MSFDLPYGLAEGNVNLRLVAITNGFNLNWLNFKTQAAQTSARSAQPAASFKATPEAAGEIAGYPNPVETSFYLRNAAENTPVQIVDLTGRVVLRATVRNGAVEVGTLSAGTYVLLIEGQQGTQRLKLHKK